MAINRKRCSALSSTNTLAVMPTQRSQASDQVMSADTTFQWSKYRATRQEMLAQASETTEFLYDGLISSEITNLIAQQKMGKSLLALYLAQCFLNDRPFLGRAANTTATERRVVLILSEATQEWRRRIGQHLSDDPSHGDLELIQYPFGNPTLLQSCGEDFAPKRGDLVIMDSLTGTCGDLTDSKLIHDVYTPLKEWAQQGAAVLVLAHAIDGPKASRALGFSQVGFAARTHLTLNVKKDRRLGDLVTLEATGNSAYPVTIKARRSADPNSIDHELLPEAPNGSLPRPPLTHEVVAPLRSENDLIADYMEANCRGLKRVHAAAQLKASHWPDANPSWFSRGRKMFATLQGRGWQWPS